MNPKPYPEYKDSGVAWLGKVPRHWEMRKTKYSFNERVQKGFPNEQLLAATQTKGVVPKTHYENRTVIAQKDLHLLKLVKKGDFVISLRSFQGGIELAHYQGIISPAYTIMNPKKEISGGYFKHLAKSKLFIKLLTTCVTGIREGQNIDYEILKRNRIPIPTPEEQLAIARFLDYKTAQIARFIKAKKRMIELLKEQKQVIINDAVTGKIDVATGKPYRQYKDSGVELLGQVPEGWETRKITTVCALIIDGTHFSPKSDTTGDYLYITAKNIKETGLDLKNVTYIKSADHREIYNRCPVSRSDVLYIKDGATAGIATVNPLIEEFSLLSSVALIRTKSAILAPEYLALQFNSLKFKMHVLNNLVGGAMTRFTLEIIKRFQLLIPPILEQQQIVSYIETKTAALDLVIFRTEREIALIQEYRTRLISDVVTGKIDVRDIAIPDIANIDDTLDESIEEPEGEEELETVEAEE